ncbi:MAG: hypothetical protein ISR58_15205 [Anaerolineales bacterium]|nr:hypothetical protein [Chloroflexota bacterium]MBL6982525.1 hypothetical protein [Anaerolineales bacterium]
MKKEEIIKEIEKQYQIILQSSARAEYALDHYGEKTISELQSQLNKIHQQMLDKYHWEVIGWDDPRWKDFSPVLETQIQATTRVGTIESPDEINLSGMPALIPFLTYQHLYIHSNDQVLANEFLKTLLLRLAVTVKPGMLQFVLVEPASAGSLLAPFLKLPNTIRGNKVIGKSGEIYEELVVINNQIEEIIQTRLLDTYENIEAYNQNAEEMAIPYKLLIISDFPTGIDSRIAEELKHIVNNGIRAGVHLIASVNKNVETPKSLDLEKIFSKGLSIKIDDSQVRWDDPKLSQYKITPDRFPDRYLVESLLAKVGHFEQTAITDLNFGRIAISKKDAWNNSTRNGIRVPIGIDGKGETYSFSLGKGTVHHGLIGGITQSGKSNLLHVIINQLCMKYSPDELQLFLVDFKEGVEFLDYLAFNIPHVCVIGLESDREFGLSILQYIQTQIEKRGELFKKAGVGRITEFREESDEIMPRYIMIMDEFQVLFIEDDHLAKESGRLLEDIVRRGAAFGIHLLLASQSPSGGPAFGRRIYDQMALRIALQCRSVDAQAILGEGNDAAKQLKNPGEAIYNDDRGDKESNSFIRIAHFPLDKRRDNLKSISSISKKAKLVSSYTPISFDGHSIAQLDQNDTLMNLINSSVWTSDENDKFAWLGEPIAIKNHTIALFEQYVGSNLLIVGGNESEAYGLLFSSILSLLVQYSPGFVSFDVADFSRTKSQYYDVFRKLNPPHEYSVHSQKDATAVLDSLVCELENRINGEERLDKYFCIAGIQRWRDLRSPDLFSQSEGGKKLSRIAEEGPELGIHLITWTDSIGNLERTFKRGGQEYFDQRVALRLSESDSNALFGNRSASLLQDNRAYYRSEEWALGEVEKFKPYSIMSDDWITEVNNKLDR